MTLPLYPTLKIELEEWFMKVFKEATKRELDVFSESPRFIQHEGATHSYETVDGEEKDLHYQDMAAEIPLSAADLTTMSIEDVLQRLIDEGKKFGGRQAEYHFSRLNEAVTEVGNVIDMKNQELTLDFIFDALEQLYISFDDNGNPQMPTMVVHPNMKPRIQELMDQAEASEAVQERLRAVMNRKLEQWHEEQNRRKLVD